MPPGSCEREKCLSCLGAAALARIFSLKLGVLPDHVLPAILVDRLVLKGSVLQFVTEFFADFLATDSVEVRCACCADHAERCGAGPVLPTGGWGSARRRADAERQLGPAPAPGLPHGLISWLGQRVGAGCKEAQDNCGMVAVVHKMQVLHPPGPVKGGLRITMWCTVKCLTHL